MVFVGFSMWLFRGGYGTAIAACSNLFLGLGHLHNDLETLSTDPIDPKPEPSTATDRFGTSDITGSCDDCEPGKDGSLGPEGLGLRYRVLGD